VIILFLLPKTLISSATNKTEDILIHNTYAAIKIYIISDVTFNTNMHH